MDLGGDKAKKQRTDGGESKGDDNLGANFAGCDARAHRAAADTAGGQGWDWCAECAVGFVRRMPQYQTRGVGGPVTHAARGG